MLYIYFICNISTYIVWYIVCVCVCVYEQKNEKRERRGQRPMRGEGINKLVYITTDVSKP